MTPAQRTATGFCSLLAVLLVTQIPATARQPNFTQQQPAARALSTSKAGVRYIDRLELSSNGAVLLIEEHLSITENTRNAVTVWDVVSGRLLFDTTRLAQNVDSYPATISPDGKLIAYRPAPAWNKVVLCEVSTGHVVREVQVEGRAEFSPDGRYLAVTCHGDDAQRVGLHISEVGSGRVCFRGLRGDGEEFGPPIFLPGDRVGFQTTFGVLRIADLRTGREAVPIVTVQKDWLVSFSTPGGMWLYSGPDRRPRLIDPTSGRNLVTFWHSGSEPDPLMDMTSDGSRVVAEARPRELTVWDGQTGRFIATVPVRGGSGLLHGVSYTGDGRYIVTKWSKVRWSQFWGTIYDDEGVTVLTQDGRETRTVVGVRHIAIDRTVRHVVLATGVTDRREKDRPADTVTIHDAAAWLAGGAKKD